MDKKMLIGAIVVIVLIVIAIFAFGGGDSAPGASTSVGDSPESFSGTMKDLMARGQNIKCTFESSNEGAVVNGTVYVSGDRVRGDYRMMQEGENSFESSSIIDSEYIYTWGSTPFGTVATKIPVTENDNDAPTPDNTESGAITPDQNFDYECGKWSVDNSTFVPPQDIEFQDLSAMMPNTQQVQGVDCSVCDSVPAGEAQDQCRSSLGCS